MSAKNLTKHFLPPNADMRRLAQDSIDKHKAQQRPARTPAAPPSANNSAEQTRQRYRDLGTYGEQLMERIYKDYDSQIEDWKISFGDVVTAFARAIGGRDRTLKEAELEHQRDAALEAFVFSLLLAGSMRFLGAYVQYTLVPRIKHSAKVQWDSSMPGVGVLVPVSAPMFSSMTASAFGGVVMDNLGSHKGKAVRRSIRAAGARLFFLPKYSPDLSTPSNSSSPRSSIGSETPRNAPSRPSAAHWAISCATSAPPNAQTTSEMPDIPNLISFRSRGNAQISLHTCLRPPEARNHSSG